MNIIVFFDTEHLVLLLYCTRDAASGAVCPLSNPDSKIHVANMGPTWVLSDPDGPHVGPMNLALREIIIVVHQGVVPISLEQKPITEVTIIYEIGKQIGLNIDIIFNMPHSIENWYMFCFSIDF